MKRILTLLFGLLAVNALATVYYASPSGSSGNSGLSTVSPWPLGYAVTNAGSGNTIIVMDGSYTLAASLYVTTSSLTIQAQNKWKAALVNCPDRAIRIETTGGTVNGLTIDGLTISNAAYNAIQLASGTGHVIRNCWVQKTGSTIAGGGQASSGIVTLAYVVSPLIERNLVERNGNTPGYDAGMYLGGTNGICRNNVCRYNEAEAFQFDSHGPPVVGWQVYQNLWYSNSTATPLINTGEFFWYVYGGTNFLYNNTIITSRTYAGQVQGGDKVWMTNNIVLAGTAAMNPAGGGTVYEDYNLSNAQFFNGGSGPHDVISSTANFVNPAIGNYWLASGSPARNAARTGIAGPVDFLGLTQSSVVDIGALQYSTVYVADGRILDPAAVGSPSYWDSPYLGTINVNTMNAGTVNFQQMNVGTVNASQ